MKRILISALAAALLVAGPKPAAAVDIGEQVKLALLDHVMPVGIVGDEDIKHAFVDSVIMIGKHNGYSIFDVQGGLAGNSRPETKDELGIKWLTQGFLKVHPFVRDRIKLADHWKFLNALEYGAVGGYNWTDEDWYAGLQVGLAFKLNPAE